MQQLTVKAPAKINWFLSVLGRRPDGYHDIVSLMQCVDLCDTLSLENSGRIELISDMDVPVERNLAFRAAVLLRDFAGIGGGAVIRLTKEIPAGAGLGGGSSDAAAVLKGLNRLWGLRLPADILLELGGRLGSDVPFFITGGRALAEGRGEVISGMDSDASISLLLVKPGISVSTAWAYGALAPKLTKNVIDIKLFCHALDSRDLVSVGRLLHNDLEPVVTGRYPEIADIRDALLDSGAACAAMSGSGSAVFGVFGGRDEAEAAAARFAGRHWCRTASTLASHETDAGQVEDR